MLAGLKCPCHGIILDGTLKTCCSLAKPTKNYCCYNYKLWCGQDDLDVRQSVVSYAYVTPA